jgi:hypothetical protein
MRLGITLFTIAFGGCLAIACATGTTPLTLDDGTGVPDGGISIPPTTGQDSSTTDPPDPPVDAATGDSATIQDAGKDVAVPTDGGTTTGGGGNCVGTVSAQITPPTTYDVACDNFYFNSLGDSNDCTPGPGSCAGLDTPTLKFCCYKPPAGSDCWFDYFATPQCLPK